MNKKLDLSVLGWFATLAVVLLVLFGWAAWSESHREWMNTQRQYLEQQQGAHEKARLEAEAAGQPAPKSPEAGKLAIRQVIASELNRVDRCTTCHLGIDDSSQAKAAQPFTTHSNVDLITVNHPTERFGCTVCHHGQGMGTTAQAAHGFVHKWDYPMLGSREAMTKYVQASCAQCHTDSTKWTAIGADSLARGEKIFAEKACLSCHKLGDQGGAIGPELTFEGSKVPDQFSFELLKKNVEAGQFGEEAKKRAERGELHHDVVDWHYYHFKNPALVSSGSMMPAFGFTDQEIDDLITYLLSRQQSNISPAMLTSDANIKAVPLKPATAKAAAPEAKPVETKPVEAKPAAKVDGTALYTANCASCHQATGAGVPGAFPPLAGAEIPNGPAAEHIAIVLKGHSGPMTVLGKTYNSVMPPFAQLSDDEIAAIVNHERTSWGNHGAPITAADVKAKR